MPDQAVTIKGTQPLIRKDTVGTRDEFMDDFSDSLMMAAMIVMVGVFVVQMLPQVTSQGTFIQTQVYTGAVDSRTLNANGSIRWINLVDDPPRIPWVAADFFNDGPGLVYIGINSPGPWTSLNSGEGSSINMIGALKRIEGIFYKCDPGQTASVRVVGKY